MRLARFASVIVLTALAFVAMAGAQENAELTGTVMDQSGAAVPNATVTITNAATGDSHTASTNSTGLYDFPGLHIGNYTLEVQSGKVV